MILAQLYKTLAGAQRRATFETSQSKRFTYFPIKVVGGAGSDGWKIVRKLKELKGV